MAEATFAGVANVTEVISAAGQAAVIAEINKVKALIHAGTATSAAKPIFDGVNPEYAHQLRLEIDALIAAIDAAPTA